MSSASRNRLGPKSGLRRVLVAVIAFLKDARRVARPIDTFLSNRKVSQSFEMKPVSLIVRLRPVAAPAPSAWMCSFTVKGRRLFSTTTVAFSANSSSHSKVFRDADAAVADVKSGSTILSAGFALTRIADTIIEALRRRGPDSLHSLTAVSNNAGQEGKGGLAILTSSGQVKRLVLSYLGNNKVLEKKYLSGELAIELCPQGTLAERIRAAGAGIPAFFTPTAANTLVEKGEIPVQLDSSGAVVERGRKRETREFNGKTFLMETALPGDVAILRAWKVDKEGNCVFRYTTKAFGLIMAKAATTTIVEAENIVEVGEIDPNDVHLPGIYVDRIVPSTAEKRIEILKTREEGSSTKTNTDKSSSPAEYRRNLIAKRASKELKDGYYVNLGVGMPTLAASMLPPGRKVWIQSENGFLGMGPYPTADQVDPDSDIVNAGKETVTLVPGASCFDSAESFGMIRGGHVDVSILGALQVSAAGDLANYMIPGKVFKGMGGAMDLVANPDSTKIIVVTDHVAKDGTSKIVQECSLPLTGARVASTIITDLCVFQVDRAQGTLTLTELAPGVTVEEVRSKTDAKFEVDLDPNSTYE
ncbi:Succinyl-CoA:3-ketoacid coenzyme A transferase 1 [Paramyrothecium foliicola]|nr:Succinyl-CoA:3-ketoacid coenzyme A transferase 1 [Paramyrothecium foliicola]